MVAGATGYAGALAAELVWNHPRLELVLATARSETGERLDHLYPRYRARIELTELDLDEIEEADAAIVAYPHGAAVPVVAVLRGLGVQVVDLSADYRLRDIPTYEKWYGPHGEADLLQNAVYGLPELHRARIAAGELIANPGCYPTAALLALAPLAEAGLIESVVIDAKSGVSGAGRGGGEAMSFVSRTENCAAYGLGGHRHLPEIEQELEALTPAASSASSPGAAGSLAGRVTFVPHLLPVDQGLLASCYVDLSEEVEEEALARLYDGRYRDEPFVEVTEHPPGIRDVRDTNLCRIHATGLGERKVAVFAVIDNLWKGASGQAIQNLNLMLGLDEREGLR